VIGSRPVKGWLPTYRPRKKKKKKEEDIPYPQHQKVAHHQKKGPYLLQKEKKAELERETTRPPGKGRWPRKGEKKEGKKNTPEFLGK